MILTIVIVIIIIIVIIYAWGYFTKDKVAEVANTSTAPVIVIGDKKYDMLSKQIESLETRLNDQIEETHKCKVYIIYLEEEFKKLGVPITATKVPSSVRKSLV